MKHLVKVFIIIVVIYSGYKIIEAKNKSDDILGKGNNNVCSINDISIGEVDFRFSPSHRGGAKQLLGAAYLTNRCATPVGVQIRQVGVDKSNNVISVHTFWPASIENIQPGKYEFALYPVPFDERIDDFKLIPESVRVW